MNILVFVKCVPSTDTRIKIASDAKSIDDADVKLIISPYDEYALEEALKLREAAGEGSVTVVSLGDARCQAVLRQALAMGADKAVLLDGFQVSPEDGLATARVLAAAAKALSYDLILTGKQGVGHDRSQVGPMIAELCDIPHASVVVKLEMDDSGLNCTREIESGREHVKLERPALVSCQKGLNEPRYANLKGIMMAKKKPLETWGPDKLVIDGAAQPGETWTSLELPPPRSEATVLTGDPKDMANELVRLLSEEAKVI